MNPVPIISLPVITALATTVGADTRVSLGEAAAVFVFTAGLIWWLSKKLQRLEDDIRQLRDDLRTRPCQRGDCPEQETDD